jgi:hypothetical protein
MAEVAGSAVRLRSVQGGRVPPRGPGDACSLVAIARDLGCHLAGFGPPVACPMAVPVSVGFHLTMSATGSNSHSVPILVRLGELDWKNVRRNLDENGYARLPGFLSQDECRSLRELYPERGRFRSFIDMNGHGYGAGDYRYFARPLPDSVARLRTGLYRHLAQIANSWSELLGADAVYPDQLEEYLAHCMASGQSRPTPLLLRYEVGGYNRMHQDLYGAQAFPLQVAFLLSAPGADRDFTGGEFLISEHRPRRQVRAEAIALGLGDGIVFANAERPVPSARGFARANMRHGASRVRTGERFTLGVIFHDAE